MNQQQPPAGWYDDPAGSGGRRYWNGSAWTEQVQGVPGATGSDPRERLPEGWMLLNGQRVPLGQTQSVPQRRPSGIGGNAVAALVVLTVAVLALVTAGLLASVDTDPTPVEQPTFEVEELDDYQDFEDLEPW
ncbi:MULTISPECIES: DUF2510 domain-containing protein [unclassified Aeromicrobium]|uniref:DUF2510 domain-containing protein n=1 Tax=unclassified Aeromicrobium TaxID=2633570 RepID=UPI00396B222D